MSLSGHFWTLGGLALRTLRPAAPPPSERWKATLDDPDKGPVLLSGVLSRPPAARHLVVLVHGLGGSSESDYMAGAAASAWELGLATLRLSLRGADGEGGDFYHGGLTADLRTAAHDLAGGFDTLGVLGFSLGGHIALRFATENLEPVPAAVAALCSPLDLAAGADAIDRPHMAIYRHYVLNKLKANYEKTAAAGSVPTPPETVRRVRTIRHWDALTVVPRFGFDDTDDYYRQASVGGRLDRLRAPALLVAAEHDPMIPPSAIRPALTALERQNSPAAPATDGESPRVPDRRPAAGGNDRLAVRWLPRGGHLGFPSTIDLGFGDRAGATTQTLAWLATALDRGSR